MTTANSRDFKAWTRAVAGDVRERLQYWLSDARIPAGTLAEAMRYATLSAGKRLRPAVIFAVTDSGDGDGGRPPGALDFACALECIHCYSLIHDDLPCMDDDDMRRGQPACHKAYGDGMTVLAGDCLHSLAFEIAAVGAPNAAAAQTAVAALARAAGACGMGGGQALDIAHAAQTPAELEHTHRLKTGALFDCALTLAASCRALGDEERAALKKFSPPFGLLYQIGNDIQDLAQDRARGKKTFASELGDADARRRADACKREALAAAEPYFPRLAEIVHAVYP